MTIKNTKKNISAEDGEIVKNIQSNAPSKSDNVSNFSTDQKITITFKDFYEEDNNPRDATVTIPLSELVRQGYLQDNYYTKEEVDAHIKLHYEILSEIPSVPNKQWAESVRLSGKQNYIFLIPFEGGYDESDTESHQDGYYIEYFYSIEDNDATFATEKMEKRGSTKIDLADYLKTSALDTSLQNLVNSTSSSSYKTLVNQVSDNTTDVSNLESDLSGHTHGNITNDGKMAAAHAILTTDSNKKITTAATIPSLKVKNPALSNIGTAENASLQDINAAIDTIIGNLQPSSMDLSLYELKSDLKLDVWGSTGFLPLQNAETDPVKKAAKLGEYIYQHLYTNFYTKTDIDTLIASVAELQSQTFEIL